MVAFVIHLHSSLTPMVINHRILSSLSLSCRKCMKITHRWMIRKGTVRRRIQEKILAATSERVWIRFSVVLWSKSLLLDSRWHDCHCWCVWLLLCSDDLHGYHLFLFCFILSDLTLTGTPTFSLSTRYNMLLVFLYYCL